MKPRRAELWLLIALSVIVAAGYTLMGLGRNASVPANALPFLGQLLALFGIAHIATRRLAPRADPRLLPLAGLLNGLGYILITRLDTDLAALQASWTAFGIAAYVLTLMLVKRTRDLARYRWTFALIGV
ncbi:MAG: FtsW/RodA/SpoVE family cell cycle protein, partial [Acidimicrobiales bacterium]